MKSRNRKISLLNCRLQSQCLSTQPTSNTFIQCHSPYCNTDPQKPTKYQSSLNSHLISPHFILHYLFLILFVTYFALTTAQLQPFTTQSWPSTLQTSNEPRWTIDPAEVSSTPTPALLIESFSNGASSPHANSLPKFSTVNKLDYHSNANQQSETEAGEEKHTSARDPINRSTSTTQKRPKSLPNQSHRQSKLGDEFPVGSSLPGVLPAPISAEQRNEQQQPAKPKGSGNQPSSMDDIIGGLLTLMGGNMKLPPGSQQAPANGNSASEKLSHLLANLGGVPKSRPHQQNGPQRPPIPPFGSLPNMNMAKLQNGRLPAGMGQHPERNQFQLPPGVNQFPMYQNFPFMPLMSTSSGGRPAIPLNGVVGGNNFPKLPPNMPPLNGMTKAEMDALYAQFMNSGGPDKTALISNLLKMAANKPLLPGLQLPPGLILPSKPMIQSPKTHINSEAHHELSNIQSTFQSMNTMQPMTEPPFSGNNRVHYTNSIANEEPPQIITMAEEPSIFEMVVKHKLGPSVQPSPSSVISVSQLTTPTSTVPYSTRQYIRPSKPVDSSTKATVNFQSNPQDVVVQEIRNQHGHFPLSKDQQSTSSSSSKADIVYGKRITKPTNSHQSSTPYLQSTLMPSFSSTANIAPSRTVQEFSPSPMSHSAMSNSVLGKPMVVPVEVDEHGIRPKVGRGGSIPSSAAIQTTSLHIEPTRTFDGATRVVASKSSSYLPTGKGGSSSSNSQVHAKAGNSNKGIRDPSPSSAKPYVRRPQFRPRPNVPIVRIDTCIVGDDSTCDISLNEKCLTELGLSSCQCRPGFARIQPRTQCIPVLSLSLSFRIDKMNGNKVQFTRPLLNSNSEEYQYLEYESIIALNSMFSATKTLATELMGVKVNRFYSVGGKTIVNATVNLRAESNETDSVPVITAGTVKRTLQQELMQVIASTNNQLGDSQLWVDSHSNAITRIDDLNECSSADHHDCSKHARCYNEFGTFRCECETGYEDKYAEDKHKAGRHCASCSPSHCSNRGECLIVRGERVCKCRANFIGAQCDIDAEVLGVAVGGSIAALIIIIITFICLYMWNQRFKQEQQKIEAMSAASGHTFSYVNKHGPPTMSRMSIDERYGRSWATHYSDSQQHLLASSTAGSGGSNTNSNAFYGVSSEHHQVGGQPVYATPVRVIGQSGTAGNSATLGGHEGSYEHQQIPYPDYGAPSVRSAGRSLKGKPQNSTLGTTTRQANQMSGHHSLHYPSYAMKLAPDSYNETEFSTRELIYSPAHLYATNPRSSHGFYS